MKAGKIVLLIFGIIVLLISIVPLLGGGALMWAEKALRDSEGFYTTPAIRLEKDSHAIVTKPANIDLGGDWQWVFWGKCWDPSDFFAIKCDPSDFLTIKVEGSSNNSSKQIFIGVAEAQDLEAYLKDVEYDEVTDFNIRRPRLDYTNYPGTSQPQAPTTQEFWTASAHGEGTQTLEWDIEEGTYSFVLMNEDGSRGLNLNASVGVKVPAVIWGISVGLLVVGLVLLGLAILMIYLAIRRPKTTKR